MAEVVETVVCIRVADICSDATRCNRLAILRLVVFVNGTSQNVGWMSEWDSDAENEHVEL